MATGHLPSKIVASTDVNATDGLELLLFGGVKSGDEVIVTVYEQELFRHGALAELHVKAFSHFNGFNPERTVISELRNPADLISDGKNGVLLTAKLVVANLTPLTAERKHQRFSFLDPNDIEVVACRPEQLLAAVAFGFRAPLNDLLFPPASVIRIPQNRFAKNLRLYVVVSHPQTHKIIFSGSAEVSATAPQASHAPKIGGSGREPGGPAADMTLRPDGDVTGIYEAFSDSGQRVGADIPELMVQLNQAGHAVAGWFTRPEEKVVWQDHLRIERPELPDSLAGVEHGILLGQFDGMFHFNWGPTDSTFIDPTFEKVRDKHTGTIEIINPANLKLTFRRSGESATLFLRQRAPTPRWSNKAITELLARSQSDGAEKQLRETLRGYYVQPIPLAFWNQLAMDMTEQGVLGQLIIAERTAPPGSKEKIRHREDISLYLKQLLDLKAYHRDEVVSEFIVKAGGVEMQIDAEFPPSAGDDKPGTKPLTVLDWLVRIQKEHLDRVDPEHKMDVAQVHKVADIGFVNMGLVSRHAYLYRLKFHNIGVKIPLRRGVAIGAYVAALDITKLILKPGEEPKPDGEFNAKERSATVERTAYFGDIGTSSDRNFKVGGATAPVSEIEFRSFHNLRPKDFDGATFNVFSASVLSVSNSAFTFFQGPNSMMIVLTVRRSSPLPVQLIAGIDAWYSKPSVTSQPFKLHKKDIKITLVSISTGTGWIGPGDPYAPNKPTEDQVDPDERLADVHTSIEGFFRVNSATLEARSLAGVEEAMAVDRAMFVSGGGFATAIGHASPEGSAVHNQLLSVKRADAIHIAMDRAFGKRLAIEDVEVIGRGSNLAEAEGMLKLPVPPALHQTYDDQYRGQFKEYRFVVLNVNGVLLFRMAAGQVTPADDQ